MQFFARGAFPHLRRLLDTASSPSRLRPPSAGSARFGSSRRSRSPAFRQTGIELRIPDRCKSLPCEYRCVRSIIRALGIHCIFYGDLQNRRLSAIHSRDFSNPCSPSVHLITHIWNAASFGRLRSSQCRSREIVVDQATRNAGGKDRLM